MYNSEYGRLIEGRTVQFERLFPVPVEFAWCYLTAKELLATWLGEGCIECRIGGAVRLHTLGNSISGVVTSVKPYKRLVYCWSPSPNGMASDVFICCGSLVTFDLRPEGEKAALKVTHAPVLEEHFARALALWHAFLDRLAASMFQLQPESFLRRYNRLLPEYDCRYPQKVRPTRSVRRRTFARADEFAVLHA
jgi:uncharacterized protein YndB with AHSA1/START domain